MSNVPALAAALAKAALAAWLFAAAGHAARPHDPFVLRAALREKPRMIVVALHEQLSVAYDGPGCGLYQAWRGGVQDGNATYNHQTGGNHGATYYPQGKILHLRGTGAEISETPVPDTRPKSVSPPNQAPLPAWAVTLGGTAVPVRVDYRGYTIDNATETVTLRYHLFLGAGNQKVEVSEYPEAVAGADGVALQRDFAVAGLPAGHVLALQLGGNPVRKADNSGLVAEEWTAGSGGTVENRSGKAFLVFAGNGSTRVTGKWR